MARYISLHFPILAVPEEKGSSTDRRAGGQQNMDPRYFLPRYGTPKMSKYLPRNDAGDHLNTTCFTTYLQNELINTAAK